MSILSGPAKLNKEQILKSAKEFAKDYNLTEEELNELNFICESFVKYYNNLSNKETVYSPKMVAESFDTMLNTQLTGIWSGLNTRANLFYKQVPELEKIFQQDTLDKKIANRDSELNEKNKEIRSLKRELDSTKAENKRLKTKTESTSRSSSYSSYGGCGGSYSYGPSC